MYRVHTQINQTHKYKKVHLLSPTHINLNIPKEIIIIIVIIILLQQKKILMTLRLKINKCALKLQDEKNENHEIKFVCASKQASNK
jgi:hypothetical protein